MDNLPDARAIAAELEKKYHPREVIISEMGATIATYTGNADSKFVILIK